MKNALKIFLFSASIRLFLQIIFYFQYGIHATRFLEIWFYVGVLRGTHLPTNQLWDLTVWVFRTFSWLPSSLHLFAIESVSIVLVCCTAVLIYLLTKKIYSEKTALYAGLIYTLLPQPLSMSVASFTHDILAIPLMLLFLWLLIGKKIITAVIVFIAAVFINQTAYIGILVMLIFIIAKYLNHKAAFFCIAIICIVMYLQLEIILNCLPQGRYGSTDIRPLNILSFITRYHFYIVFLVLTLSSKNKIKNLEFIPYTIFVFGLVCSIQMDRGSRLLDIAISMICAQAITKMRDSRILLTILSCVSIMLALLFIGQYVVDEQMYQEIKNFDSCDDVRWDFGYMYEVLTNNTAQNTPNKLKNITPPEYCKHQLVFIPMV